MGGLRLVAERRALVGPAAFLLAVTVAIVLLHSTQHRPAPPPVRSHHPRPASRPAGPRFYHVAPGDTLIAIATKTRVPYARIRALNPALEPTALFVGEKIRLR